VEEANEQARAVRTSGARGWGLWLEGD
jgi:hypothetical protein